jgi:hypothetical protein
LRIGQTLTDAEFREVDLEFWRPLEAARKQGSPTNDVYQPFSSLAPFLSLIYPRAYFSNFKDVYVEITAILDEQLPTVDQLSQCPSLEHIRPVVGRIIICVESIDWVINLRSTRGTLRNAFRELARILTLFNKARIRTEPHSHSIEKGTLHDMVLDTMIKICDVADHQGITASLIDQAFFDAQSSFRSQEAGREKFLLITERDPIKERLTDQLPRTRKPAVPASTNAMCASST